MRFSLPGLRRVNDLLTIRSGNRYGNGATKVLIAWVQRRREAARLAQSDAAVLICENGARAYAEARRRERVILFSAPAERDRLRDRGHWRRVAGIIAAHVAA